MDDKTTDKMDRPSSERGTRVGRLHLFLGIFALVYLVEAMGGMYIISAVQNIEKQFRLPSKLSGLLVSASDIGYIPTVVFIAYFAGKGNRARWIGAGLLGMALAYLAIASPHFLFPNSAPRNNSYYEEGFAPSAALRSENVSLADLLQYPLIRDRFPSNLSSVLATWPPSTKHLSAGQDAEDNKKAYHEYIADSHILEKAVSEGDRAVSEGGDSSKVRALLVEYIRRRSSRDAHVIRRAVEAPFSYCSSAINAFKDKVMMEKCESGESSHGPFIVLFLALLLLGVGRTMPWSLGIPLLDDNVSKKSVPVYFGALSFIRILGPISGFLIASIVNKFYYTFHAPEGLSPNDASWIGAWWIGFIFIGILAILPSMGLCFFPQGASKNGKQKEINFVDKHRKESNKDSTAKEKFKEFGRTFQNVLKSRVYTYSAIGRVLDTMAFKGYVVFLPKYLENHFGIPRYLVHRYMALFGIFGFAAGSGLGGLLTKKLRFTGKQAALFVLLVSTLNISIYFSKTFIACDSIVNTIGTDSRENNYNLTQSCNAGCACEDAKLYPVCDVSGNVFFSPCHAGCRQVSGHGEKLVFSNCDCTESGEVAKFNCKNKSCSWATKVFFGTVVLGSLMAGLGIVPGLLLVIRSIPPETRSAALGLQGFLVSLFGTLPSPIIWGFIVDSTCQIWEPSCDSVHGSCAVYDSASLRTKLHLTYTIIRAIALITDVLVLMSVGNLKLIDDDKGESMEEEVQRGSIRMRELPSQ